ncbi:AAC(3) family N-acetyltransferase [Candidatus Sumerlaeota bacterium]|nr:AAC(3) family N-acetyltransferase [Candidatus Sumerlaeota bacterium]
MEIDAIQKSANGPVTAARIVKDLDRLGARPGMTLLVHASLSAMGWVCGGAVAVIQALETVLTDAGTLIMPAHSSDFSDPCAWENPPVDPAWWKTIRQTMPAFDVNLTPTRKMGAIAECFRKQPGVVRSNHPQHSFAAWGKHAKNVVANHSLERSLGDHSPLAKIYKLDGSILLLGVGYDSCTSMHLAEDRSFSVCQHVRKCGAPIMQDGKRCWIEFMELNYNSGDFHQIGMAYEDSGNVLSKGMLGYAESILIPQRSLVDFSVSWMDQNRNF